MSRSSDPETESFGIGKTLLGNWVEERQVAPIDSQTKSIKQLHHNGHQGILTQTGAQVKQVTTHEDMFKNPDITVVQEMGKRRMMREQQLYEQINAEQQAKANLPPPPVDFTSTTKKDYNKEFVPTERQFTRKHDANSDAGTTFWNQNINEIDGVTGMTTRESPFKKNAAFSTPITEYLDSPKPGETWSY